MDKKIMHIHGYNISVDSMISAINELNMEELDALFELLPETRLKANIEADKIIERIMQ